LQPARKVRITEPVKATARIGPDNRDRNPVEESSGPPHPRGAALVGVHLRSGARREGHSAAGSRPHKVAVSRLRRWTARGYRSLSVRTRADRAGINRSARR
jgi:hypothetical protein